MRVLFAYECGSGLGHVIRIAEIAARLKRNGVDSVLASYRLDDIEPFARDFDDVLQAPVWPMFFDYTQRDLERENLSYASLLANLGLRDSHHVAINQRAWLRLLDQCNPSIVVADYAPGAVLAAKGRCPSLQIGSPFYTPALDDETFPPFLLEQPDVAGLDAGILDAIRAAARQLGRSEPAGFRDTVIADKSMPMGFAEFDPYLHCRREPLLHPDMVTGEPLARGEGEAVYVYLPSWMQSNDVLVAALCTLGLPIKLFTAGPNAGTSDTLRQYGVQLADALFSPQELAKSARLFLHHGGTGSCQIGLMAGVPQIIIESDLEKIFNSRALTALGVCRSLNYYRLTLPKIRDVITEAFNDTLLQQRSCYLTGDFRARLRGPHPHDVVVDHILSYR